MDQSQINTPEDARKFLVSFFESLDAPTLIKLATYLQADPVGSADRLLAIGNHRRARFRPAAFRGMRALAGLFASDII